MITDHSLHIEINRKNSTFILPDSSPEVPIKLTPDLSKDQLLAFPAFKTWISTLQHSLTPQKQKEHTFHASPYKLRKIDVQAVDYFGGDRLGFVKLKAEVSNDDGERLPESVFLRGGSVGMMLILQPDSSPPNTEAQKHIILTLQPRIPASTLSFIELPAGMLDNSTFTGAAASEIREETGLSVPVSELINLTELAIPAPSSDAEQLQRAIYLSAGGCDEFMPIFLWQKRMPVEDIEKLRGRLTGLRERGEKITLMVCPLEEVWKVAARDAKVLCAWALYEGLRREGKI